MRFSIEKDQFLKALNCASRGIASKTPIPILSNVKLDLNDKGLEITGTNSDITVKSTVPYRIGDKEIIRGIGLGSTLINAHTLTEVVRRIEGQVISLDVIDDTSAKIADDRSSFSLNCIKADEYPDIDLEPNGVIFDLKCSDLAELVDQTAFAASTNAAQRPVLMALNLQSNGDGLLTAMATDSARLAIKTIKIDTDSRFRCNIPARTLSEVVRMFEGAEYVRIAIGDNKALFDFDNTIVSSRLVSGDFPVNKGIVPVNFNYFLEVNGQEILNAMGRASILSVETGVIRLSMREDSVEISARSSQAGSANEKIQTFSYAGERLEIYLKASLVADAIKALHCEDVTLCFQAEMRPFIVKNPKDDTVIQLITPYRAC